MEVVQMFISIYCQKYKQLLLKLQLADRDFDKRFAALAQLERFFQDLKASFGVNTGQLIEIFD